MFWPKAEVAALNFQVVPISQVVLKTGFTVCVLVDSKVGRGCFPAASTLGVSPSLSSNGRGLRSAQPVVFQLHLLHP